MCVLGGGGMDMFWAADEKNEWTLKREGTFKGQMNHIRPQLIVLFNPQSHSVVLTFSHAAHVGSVANHNRPPRLCYQVNLKVKHESSNQSFLERNFN